ncbi:Inorganic triphosphatase [Kordia antarctica]|uniref:Inorganic triphosphatase n=1 Tax=Kordia antarctica TaxID=1218801 RepID=A0A7L4ZLW4_9FLAO|nr:CYTH domain-containing protein [Kordia antarctica]QHI37642.1 Inorganic triphosphatase [Kordia antarctica]
MQEIERKFLVNNLQFKEEATNSFEIAQGYLNTHAERSVRVRIKGNQGFLTVKGKSNESGTSRFEWEKEISTADATQLLQLCEKGIIQKIRYNIPVENHTFEVDEFFGENEGLIVAEVELQHEDEAFSKPNWLGEEVTGHLKYYNSQLSKNSYKTWHHE